MNVPFDHACKLGGADLFCRCWNLISLQDAPNYLQSLLCGAVHDCVLHRCLRRSLQPCHPHLSGPASQAWQHREIPLLGADNG